MSGHTPGPWTHYHARLRPQYPVIVNEIHGPAGQLIVQWGGFDAADGSKSVRKANARLIAAAPDHAMIASALCSGVARWESFASGSGGEFCIGGLRHATNLDQFGVPVMTDGMRVAIAKATGDRA